MAITYEGHTQDYTDDDDMIMVAEPPPPLYGSETEDARHERLMKAIAYQRAGGRFLTADEFLANMEAAIEEGARRAGRM